MHFGHQPAQLQRPLRTLPPAHEYLEGCRRRRHEDIDVVRTAILGEQDNMIGTPRLAARSRSVVAVAQDDRQASVSLSVRLFLSFPPLSHCSLSGGKGHGRLERQNVLGRCLASHDYELSTLPLMVIV